MGLLLGTRIGVIYHQSGTWRMIQIQHCDKTYSNLNYRINWCGMNEFIGRKNQSLVCASLQIHSILKHTSLRQNTRHVPEHKSRQLLTEFKLCEISW